MPLFPASQKFIDSFFASIAPFEVAYEHVGFSYIALKIHTHFVIIRGRVFLNSVTPEGQPQQFASPNVRAGHYRLSELALDIRTFIARLLEGQVATPSAPLHFPAALGGHHAASFVSLHPDGLRTQTRLSVLTLMGGPFEPIPQPDIDWEIKAGSPPYDGLQELGQVLGLAPPNVSTIIVEFLAQNVAVIDGDNSKVSGTNADVRVRAAKRLSHDRFTLGYRIYLPGADPKRGTISGSAMQWTEDEKLNRGQIDIPIPKGAVLNCTISYDSIAQSHLWLADPERIQNPRRAAYESFDPKLENLKSIIANAQTRGQEARDFEMAVGWLFWMLGFNGAHLGMGRRSRDAPDQIMTTPSGNFAVVESTTGLLKAENKLALLHDRTEAVRRNLSAKSNSYLRILPVIVTSKTTAEIRPDLEAAERLGVLIVTRENLDQAINQTLLQPNADQIYAEAEQSVSAALAKYDTRDVEPTNDSI